MNRTALAQQALEAAIQVRRKARVSAWEPICPFDIAAAIGVRVQYMDISGEGIYSPDEGYPAVIINSERPGPRQRYTCAHELGHHAFGHGFRADEVVGRRPFDDPDEFMADVFAGHLLLPEVGVLKAFRSMGANPASPDVFTVFAVASEFGVGYRTLLTHLVYSTRVLSKNRADVLARHTPKQIRTHAAPGHSARELTVIDEHGRKAAYDVIAEGLVLALGCAETSAVGLSVEGISLHGPVIRAHYPGIWPLRVGDREVSVRVISPGYAGRASNRHLENDEWVPTEAER